MAPLICRGIALDRYDAEYRRHIYIRKLFYLKEDYYVQEIDLPGLSYGGSGGGR